MNRIESCRLVGLLSSALIVMMFNNVHAAEIPLHDMAGTIALSKTNLALEAGQVVHLVSLNSECHYVGATQRSSNGDMEIRVQAKSCHGVYEYVETKPVPMKGPIKKGDQVWIPVDGIVDRIEDAVNSLEAGSVGAAQKLVPEYLGRLYTVTETPKLVGNKATVKASLLDLSCTLELVRSVSANDSGWVVEKVDCNKS